MAAHVFRSGFADALMEGNVVSLRQDGKRAFVVTSQPVRVPNLVGERTSVMFQARLAHAPTTGQMILSPANVVYIRHEKGA